MIKALIQSVFSTFNYELIKKNSLARLRDLSDKKGLNTGNTMTDSLLRLKAIGITPGLIIDVGAAKGKWTEKALSIWPDSDYVLIEPLKEQLEQVSKSLKESGKITFIEAVAGDKQGNVSFNVSVDLDGSGIYGESENTREVQVVKLDDITTTINEGILLKLDTHGYEIPIFQGSDNTLLKTDVIIVEVYGFNVSPTALLFHEISGYLFSKGFRLYDVVDIMRRDSDKAFWQADAIYLRNSSRIFACNEYTG